jgi:hypothetical protein
MPRNLWVCCATRAEQEKFMNSSIPIVIKGGGNHMKGPSQKAARAKFLLHM